ncbi:MAG: hypothetical protein ACXQTZ_00715 [Candidatus Alkanophagales archaeon]
MTALRGFARDQWTRNWTRSELRLKVERYLKDIENVAEVIWKDTRRRLHLLKSFEEIARGYRKV